MKYVTFIILIVAYTCAAAVGWGQVLADPNDQIYRFLLTWEQKGYLSPLPPLRPYPLQVVQAALETVVNQGNARDAEVAQGFLDELVSDAPALRAEGFHNSQLRKKDYQALFGFGLRSTRSITDAITYSARGRMMLERVPDGDVFPQWSDVYESTIYTEAKHTGQYQFSFVGQDINTYGAFNGVFFFGSDRLYGQFGLVRSSFGPFIESPVLGPQAPLAGQFSATYRSDALTLSMVFLELVARYGVSPDGDVYGLKGVVDYYPSKHLVLHSIDVHPTSWLSFGVFQTAVVAARFSPIYLFPFTQYIQNYFGDWDNAFVGLNATVSLPFDLQYDLIAYVDDINLSKMLKLDFNSNNNRVAIRTGLSWIAPLDIPNRAELTYVMLTPYVYTHWSNRLDNYLQYTHQGEHLGSILEPNSDQWNVRLFAMPLRWLRLEGWLHRTRHGNGSDYGEGSVDGDGSIFDDGTLADGTRTYTGPSSFMIQDTLERAFQLGLSAEVKWEMGPVAASLRGEYSFETIKNRDLDPAADDEVNHYLHIGLTLTY